MSRNPLSARQTCSSDSSISYGPCADDASPYAHTRTFSRCARHMRSHVWLKGLTILGVSRKVISSLVMSLLNVSSTPFPPIFSSSPKSAFRSVFSQIVDMPLPQILEEIINVAFLTSGASSAATSPNHSSWKKLCRVVQIILRTAHLEARFTAR